MYYTESETAIKLALGEIQGAEAASLEDTAPIGSGISVNGNSSALSPYQKTQIQNSLQRKKDESLVLHQAAQDAVDMAERVEEAKWLLFAASRSSEQVQQSDRVTKAREFALGISDGGLSSNSHIESVDAYLEELGFFSGLEPDPLLAGQAATAALPDYVESGN